MKKSLYSRIHKSKYHNDYYHMGRSSQNCRKRIKRFLKRRTRSKLNKIFARDYA